MLSPSPLLQTQTVIGFRIQKAKPPMWDWIDPPTSFKFAVKKGHIKKTHQGPLLACTFIYLTPKINSQKILESLEIMHSLEKAMVLLERVMQFYLELVNPYRAQI